MSKWMNGWRYLTGLGQGLLSARKWLLAYVALILLPASVMLTSYYQRTNRFLEDEVTRSMQATVKQAGMNLTYKLDHVRDLCNSVFMNPILYDNLTEQQSITAQLGQLEKLRYLAGTVQENEDIVRLRIFVEPNRLYASERINVFSMADMMDYPWYPAVLAAGGGMVWTGVYQESYNDTGDKQVFSVARLLRDPLQFEKIIGVLVIDVSEELIGGIVSQLPFPAGYAPFLAGTDGTVIYSGGRSSSYASGTAERVAGEKNGAEAELFQLIRNRSEGIAKVLQGGEEVYGVYSTLGTTDWKLVAQMPQSDIAHRAAARNQLSGIATVAGITVMFLILVFVLLAFTIQGMKRRIQVIIRMIRKQGVDWLEDRRAFPDSDFRLLEQSVDYMIHRVNSLMEESYRVKVQEREAQLRALQAQINPHFLYNTLDMINWSAIGHGAEDTSRMIEELARYFRLSLSKGKDNVSIADELELARVYLQIQQNRFPSTFTYEIAAAPGLEQFSVPKLTLQPLVENALLHGIRRSKEKQGRIVVSAVQSNGELLLSVADDGIGMEEQLVKRLLLEPHPEPGDSPGSSYGLFNINERIRYFAGERYGLHIVSSPEKGTTVTVKLKAIAVNSRGLP